MTDTSSLTALTAMITANFVANNRVGTGEIGGVIGSVYSALEALGVPVLAPEPEFTPAVTIRKSLSSPDKIISMIDGKPYSLLKRHLTTQGLTPAEYRARYNLPADYPMTAPAYAERRKQLALKIGLGRKKAVSAATVDLAPPAKARRKTGLTTPK